MQCLDENCMPLWGRRELTLLGKWAIFFSGHLLVNYCGISTKRLGTHVAVAV
jgi:hypothetical protein